MDYTKEEISEAYKKSSLKIQEILNDDWITTDAGILAQNFNLRIDKINILIKLIGFTLLNLIPISSFTKTLSKELGINETVATDIAKDIDIKIFQKVRRIVNGEINTTRIEEVDEKIVNDTVDEIIDEIEDQKSFSDNTSFKEKLNKVIVKKNIEKIVDPYREPID